MPAALVLLFGLRAAAEPSVQPDAVIELWQQDWTLNDDGSTVYHEKQHVRMNNERANGEFADPRLTYNADTDKLEIIAARVKLPDGTYRELPDYAHVLVSPDITSGWPAFAAIRQHLLVMSGIQPGCLIELEYKITSKPGARPGLAADVRLDHRYPVKERIVSITAPAQVQPVLTGPGTDRAQTGPRDGKATSPQTRTWALKDLPAVPDEPQSPPWQKRCARFAFSSAQNADYWMQHATAQIERAADDSELATKLAADWTKDAVQPSDKLRVIQEKLAGSFNFVDFNPDWQRGDIRAASESLRNGYGLPEEAAAVLLSLGRAAGLPVRAAVVVKDDLWLEKAPHESQVAAYVVLLDGGKEPEIWDAHLGRIVRDARWAGASLLIMGDASALRVPLPAFTDADDSRCAVAATITLKNDGTYSGTVSLSTTGLFVAPEGLRAGDAQKSRVNALVGRVLPDATVESFSVKELSDSEFTVEAKVKSSKALKKVGGAFWLQMPQDAPYGTNITLPLAYAERRLPVRLTGPFSEQVKLTIEYPEGWTVEAQPVALALVKGEWGEAEQRINPGEHRLTLLRSVRITQREIAPQAFLALREPLNTFRTDAARAFVLKPN